MWKVYKKGKRYDYLPMSSPSANTVVMDQLTLKDAIATTDRLNAILINREIAAERTTNLPVTEEPTMVNSEEEVEEET